MIFSSITMDVIFNLVIWIIIWFSSWGIFNSLEKKKNWYITNPIKTTLFFLTYSILAILTFPNILNYFKNTSISLNQIVILIIWFIINLIIYFYSINKINLKKDLFSHEYFKGLNYKYILSKSFEIAYQQLMILVLIITIYNLTDSILKTCIYFSIFFALVHTPIYFKIKNKRSTFILFSAFFSGLIFPILILSYDFGIIYSYIVHWMYYTLSRLTFLEIKSRSHPKK